MGSPTGAKVRAHARKPTNPSKSRSAIKPFARGWTDATFLLWDQPIGLLSCHLPRGHNLPIGTYMNNMCGGWDGIEYADDWNGLGCDPEEARAWAMDPMIAEQWMRTGESPTEAHAWVEIGLDPGTADWWLSRNEDPEDVIDAYRLALADPLYQRVGSPDLSAWVRDGYTLEETVLYIRAGITLAEAALIPPDPRLETIAALRERPRPIR